MITWAAARNSTYSHPLRAKWTARPKFVRETLRTLFLRSDTMAPRETLAHIMALFAMAGSSRIGFGSDPTSGPRH